MKKRLLSVIMTLALCLTLLPTAALATDPPTEQFSGLTPGETYWFDLSGVGIPDDVNSNLPDYYLFWVPFTYAGTVNAYKRANAGVSTEDSVTSYLHSLFIADYNVNRGVGWDELNEKDLIFGKRYTSGGVDYTLRAPSAGSSGDGDSGGAPRSNEWDAILDKNSGYIKNWNDMRSWGQDTFLNGDSSRARRGLETARRWNSSYAADSYTNVGFRPVLEILNPGTLGSDGLTTVTLDLNGGSIGIVEGHITTGEIHLVTKKGDSYTVPSHSGLIRPDDGIYFKWQDSNGNFYEPGQEIPANVTSLTAMWQPYVAPTITTQPTAQSVTAGQTAAFTVAADGYPAPTYQWQVSKDSGSQWENIPGATAAEYTTPSATMDMNGWQYQCVVTNSQGTATSAPASLTVSPINLLGADVSLDIPAGGYIYDGTEKKPAVTVTLNGQALEIGVDYTVAYDTDCKSAGSKTVTVQGTGKYIGSVTRDFTIARKSITPTIEVSGTYTYNGSAITPTFTVTDGSTALTADDYTAVFADNINAGSGKITVTEKTTGNYTFGEAQKSFTIGKAAAPSMTASVTMVKRHASYTVQLNLTDAYGYPTDHGGTPVFAVNSGAAYNGLTSATVSGSTLTLVADNTANDIADTVTVSVTGMGNYNDGTITVTVTYTDKTPVTITGVSPAAGLTYKGQPQTGYTGTPTNAQGYDGDYTVTYTGRDSTVYDASPTAPTNAGDYAVTIAVPDSVQDFAGETTLNFTIAKAEITVTADDKDAYVGDTPPALTCTVTGLVNGELLKTQPKLAYESGPDMSRAGTTAIKASDAEAPDGGNYDITYVDGTLTVNIRSSSGGGGGGSSSSSGATTKNPDGSTTTTVTDKATGTVTETTKNTDGSTTVVETKKDGTVTETNKSADGTTGTVVTDKRGDVTEVSASVSNKAAKEAEKSGEAVTLPVEVPAAKTTEDAPAVDVTVPKSAGEVKVEIPVEQVTPGTVAVIVHADGIEEIVSTSKVTENGVTLTLTGSTTVKVFDNAKSFNDVPVSNVFYNEISSLSARNIMIGVSSEKFDLNGSVTLNQIANVAGRITGNVDVKDFQAGIDWGQANGMKTGNTSATRGDVLRALYIAAGSPAVEDTSILTQFKDPIPEDLKAIAAWAAQNGILKGNIDSKGALTANLDTNVTRGQACALAGRTLNTIG
jgi:hypothetical protein